MATYGYPCAGGWPNYDHFRCTLMLAMVLQIVPNKPIMTLFDKVKAIKSGCTLALAYGGFCVMIAAISFLLHQHVCATFNIYFLTENCWWSYLVDRYMILLTVYLGNEVPLVILKIWDMSKIVVSYFFNLYNLARPISFIINNSAFLYIAGVTVVVIALPICLNPHRLTKILSELKAYCKEEVKTFVKRCFRDELRRKVEEYFRKSWIGEQEADSLPSTKKRRRGRKRKCKKGNSKKKTNPLA